MTTNTDFLKTGGLYPPRSEISRLAKYKRYTDLFNGNVSSAYGLLIKDTTSTGIIKNSMQSIFSNPRITNFARAITKKTVDLMLSRTPSIISDTSKRDMDLIEIVRTTNVWKKIKTSFVDVSRYGNGYIRIYNKIPRYKTMETLSNGEAGINVVSPELVTVVVNALDKEDIQKIIIGWIDEVDNDPNLANAQVITADSKKEYFLTLEIHEKGFYEYKRFKVENPILSQGLVKQYILKEEVTEQSMRGVKYSTGLKGFAIKNFCNFTTSDNLNEGLSDYDMFDSLMIDLSERISSLSDVFEKHGNPSMQGSEELLSPDENGDPVFYTGDFYATSDDNRLSYLTWDAKTTDILKYCNQLLEQIFMLAEMGDGSIMGYTNGSTGFAESGKAIRMKMASPLMKVQSLITDNEAEIVSSIYDIGIIMGKDIEMSKIEIRWQDGLPIDWIEETNMFNSRVASGTESITYGLQRRFGMSIEQAEDEFKRIIFEKNALQEYMNRGKIGSEDDYVEAEGREKTEKRADGKNSQ